LTASQTATLPLVFPFVAFKVLTYAIGNEEDANSKLIIVTSHAQVVFEAVQAGVADVDSLCQRISGFAWAKHTPIHEVHEIDPADHGDDTDVELSQKSSLRFSVHGDGSSCIFDLLTLLGN
jgi:hypothetical protein